MSTSNLLGSLFMRFTLSAPPDNFVEMSDNFGLSRGLNGVAMDRHGLILWDNEATGSTQCFRYLLDLQDKNEPLIPKTQKHDFP